MPLNLPALEALCAAAHDVDPRNQRIVGIPAPELRELVRVYAAVKAYGDARAACTASGGDSADWRREAALLRELCTVADTLAAARPEEGT